MCPSGMKSWRLPTVILDQTVEGDKLARRLQTSIASRQNPIGKAITRMTEAAEDNICHSTDRMRRLVVVARMVAQLVVVTVAVCGLYWLPVWVAGLSAWATSDFTPQEELLPFWMKILLASQNWFGSALPYLVLVAAVFCALLFFARRFTDASRPGTPLCLTMAEFDGHTVAAWETPVFSLQIIWFDGCEASRKRRYLRFRSRHRFSITQGTQEVEYDVALAIFPCFTLDVSRGGDVVARVRNAEGTVRAALIAAPLAAISIGVAVGLAIYAEETGLGLPILISTLILGLLIIGRLLESMDKRLIDAYFGNQVAKKRFVLPRWEWSSLLAAILVALSMWVFPTFSQYEKACAHGYGRACYVLGVRYMNGDGVNAETATALEHFQTACDLGDAYGCNYLGGVYRDGKLVEKDGSKAAELFRQACDGGVARGCYRLARMYEQGEAVEIDMTKAAELYQKACDGGYGFACFVLGDMRENGKGIETDLGAAAELYQRA